MKLFFILSFLYLSLFGSNVLLLGDSMAEALNNPLKKILTKNGNNFDSLFKRGTQIISSECLTFRSFVL